VVPDGIVAARVTSAHPATISPATSTYLESFMSVRTYMLMKIQLDLI